MLVTAGSARILGQVALSFPYSADVLSTTVNRLRAAGCVFAEEEAELLVTEATGPSNWPTSWPDVWRAPRLR